MRKLILVAALLAGGGLALAQTNDGSAGEDRGDRGRRSWDDGAGVPPDGRGGPMGFISRRLAAQLELDETQQGQFQEIVDSYRAKWTEAGGPGEQLRETMRQLRAAREAGDDAKVEELRRQMREARGAPNADMMSGFFDEVRGILHEDQIPKLEEFQQRAAERMRAGREGRGPRIDVSELPAKLDLDADQQKQFGVFEGELNEKLATIREGWRELQPLFEQMRAADEAGDEAKVEELRQQVEKSRPDPTAAYDTFFAQVNDVLRDDQRATLAAERAKLQPRGNQRGAERGTGLRQMIQAVRKLDLTNDQREKIRELTREAQQSAGAEGRRAGAESAKAAEQFRQKLLQILTPEQAQELESALKKDRPARGNRAGNSGQGEESAPDDKPLPPAKKKAGKKPAPPADEDGGDR